MDFSFRVSVLSALLIVTLLSGIKTYLSSEVQWALSGFFVFLWVIYSVVKNKKTINKLDYGFFVFCILPWFSFIASIVFSSIINDMQGIHAAIKFFIIFIFLLSFVFFTPSVTELFNALIISAMFSLILFLGAFLIAGPELILHTSDNRYGWLLAPPGVLWYSGVYLIPVLIFKILIEFKVDFKYYFFLVVASLLVGLDGSRTGIVIIVVLLLFFSMLSVYIRGMSKDLLKRFFLLVFLLFLSVFINTTRNEVSIRDVSTDPVRLRMLKEGFNGACENAPFGAGFGATVVYVSEIDGPMVIHNTYLQVLSDLGFIGFISHLYIVFAPVLFIAKGFFYSTIKFSQVNDNFLPLGILIVYAFVGLFHPISNEISEWLIIVVAVSILYNAGFYNLSFKSHE